MTTAICERAFALARTWKCVIIFAVLCVWDVPRLTKIRSVSLPNFCLAHAFRSWLPYVFAGYSPFRLTVLDKTFGERCFIQDQIEKGPLQVLPMHHAARQT